MTEIPADDDISLLLNQAMTTLLDQSGMGVAVLDRALVYRYVNATLARFNGPPVTAHIGHSIYEVLPGLADQAAPLLNEVIDSGQARRNFEIRVPTPSVPDEDSLWLASYLPVWSGAPHESEVIGVLAIAENETLVQQIERSRREASELVRRVLDSLFAFVGILDLDGTVLDANQAPLEAAGIGIEDVVGQKFWDCFWWNYDPQLQACMRDWVQGAAQGEVFRSDVQIRVLDDSRMTIDFMLAPLRDTSGRITHLIPSASDVSDRVAGEQQLKASEDRFRRVVNSTLNGLLLTDRQGAIHLVNPRACEMFGYSEESMLTLHVEDLVPDGVHHHHGQLREGYFEHPEARGMAIQRELFARRSDGSMFPVEVGLTPLYFESELRVLATVVDVSIQKTIQNRLQKALNEKTSLLNEVHHRVKNNLQVVSSLLNLQARNLPDEARHYFQESQDRIRAMALIHQLLYEQKSFDSVDAVSYVHRLVSLLKRSYCADFQKIRLRVDAPAELPVSLAVAQPFGLLINELVTNAIKHAFVGRSGGEIGIELIDESDGVRIRIRDDGIGLPAGVVPGKSKSLGFQLVPGLVEQMGAQLTLLPGVGTCFEICFDRGDCGHEQLSDSGC